MSQAVGEKLRLGSMDRNMDDFMARTVGQRPIEVVELGGHKINCLIDSG